MAFLFVKIGMLLIEFIFHNIHNNKLKVYLVLLLGEVGGFLLDSFITHFLSRIRHFSGLRG